MGITKDLLVNLAGNKILYMVVSTWAITQTIKVIIGVIRERKFDFRWFVGTGGMPSSHAATVSALTTAVGLSFGTGSALFVITGVFSVIIIFDAQGFRRSTGKQAEILNKMMNDIYWKHRIQEDRLKELLGHAPFEVLVGTLTGIAIAFLLW